ncbi:probable cytochrome P450 9f2 [Sitodiplosis mosellana]|uniref:probable cytochrome P450 9f2 n=1 Tax=Sitodiplosis mosellana TaxID=263140 RepID=UPI0024447D20|nr:probable cytochrome P450 9f2 [Sitodiplosis mosellana]
MRATLSPAFTGSKMRQMFDLTSECAEDVVKHFLSKVKSGERINAEMKEFATRYTNDVIATCAFGLKINSFSNPDNDFYKNGISLLTYRGWWDVVKSIAKVSIAKITRVFKPKIVDETITNWFKSSILDTMTKRREKNIVRPDMINILMQLREGSLTHQTDDSKDENVAHDEFAVVEESELGKMKVTRKWSENELIAQCFIFFLAGMEVSSWAITFVVYELIVNPDIQQKLYEEIVAVNDGLDGKRITYDLIQKMKFLDQVVSETLRKWPIVLETERMCTKDYVYDDGEKKFMIEKGSSIIYPIYAIQRDPKYFPNPDIFDPTRFSDANKHNILPGSYAPFGIGPRSCIASRFALMEIKVMLYYLLLNFSLEPNKNTQIPLKMKRTIAMVTEKGVHLELKPRKI